jgi:hypothetical protein
MKALPKLMKNAVVTIDIIFEEKPFLTICMHDSTTWPSIGRYDEHDKLFHFFDCEGKAIHEMPAFISKKQFMPNFGLVFIGVTESRVDFQTKTQTLVAKMRAINLDSHENLYMDNWGYDE